MNFLTDESGVFISLCCCVYIQNTPYVLAPNVFEHALLNQEPIRVVKKSPRHGYCLCSLPASYSGSILELSNEVIAPGNTVHINSVHSTVISWVWRENGTYAAQILHGGNMRLNGAAVMDSTNKRLIGMYLCTDYFGPNATFVPYDVLSPADSRSITPLLVECSGFVRGTNTYVASSLFREFDVQAEQGKLFANNVSATESTGDVSLALPKNKVFEAFEQVFMERNNQVVRLRNDFQGYLRTNRTDVVTTLNSTPVSSVNDFAKAVQLNKPNVIQWGASDRETFPVQTKFKYKGHELNPAIRVWNAFKSSFTPAKATKTVRTVQPCQPFEDI